jgi:tRNA (guanine-N7-)-methyltransferase
VSSKGKLRKFAEVENFENVLQPSFEEVFKKDFYLKGKWKTEFFKNSNPITLELGCGKGEYTLGLAKLFPKRNFLGIDIKGARIWKGAKEATEKDITNVGFIRTRIDFITSFFERGEIDEIWITFPDPQLKKPLKRLTSSRFLGYYQNVINSSAFIHLKTDSVELFHYTKALADYNKLAVDAFIEDIYQSEHARDEVLSIRTFYEKGWLKEGLKSQYIRFKIDNEQQLNEPPEEESR